MIDHAKVINCSLGYNILNLLLVIVPYGFVGNKLRTQKGVATIVSQTSYSLSKINRNNYSLDKI